MSVMSPLQSLQHYNVINPGLQHYNVTTTGRQHYNVTTTGPQHYNVTNTWPQHCFFILYLCHYHGHKIISFRNYKNKINK